MSDASLKRTVLDLLRQTREEELALIADLDDAERAATGTPERWSAKDMIAHIATWRQWHAEKLASVVRGETPPTWTDGQVVDRLNAQAHAEQQDCSWPEVQERAEHAYAALVAQVQRLSELELGDPHHFPALNGEALWPETLGNGSWHPYTHLIELARGRGDVQRLARLRDAQIGGHEVALALMEQMGAPDGSRAVTRYNLACLFTLAGRPSRALDLLAELLPARPDLALHARHDADFDALRADPAFQALTANACEVELIAPQALRAQQDMPATVLVIDVREPDEYAAGHVAGAVNIPLGVLDQRPATLSHDRPLVTYCNMYHRGTSRGERAAALLRAAGYDVAVLDGGYPGWKAAGLPVEETEARG
jgi:rhodanese-related sulfurtransferase